MNDKLRQIYLDLRATFPEWEASKAISIARSALTMYEEARDRLLTKRAPDLGQAWRFQVIIRVKMFHLSFYCYKEGYRVTGDPMKFVKSYANLEGSIWAYLYEDGSLSIELPATKNIELSPAGVKELRDVLEVKVGVQSPPEQKGCICFVNQHGVILRANPECTAHPSGGLTQRALDDGKASAKKAVSKARKSTVKKASTKPAHRQ